MCNPGTLVDVDVTDRVAPEARRALALAAFHQLVDFWEPEGMEEALELLLTLDDDNRVFFTAHWVERWGGTEMERGKRT